MHRILPLLLLASLALPAAAGQPDRGPVPAHLELSIEDGSDPIPPGGEARVYGWTLTYETTTPAAGEVEVQLEIDQAPWWADLELEPARVTFQLHEDPSPTHQQTYEASGELSASADRDAPAFHADRVTVSAHTDGNTLVSGAETTSQATVIPGWRPGLAADPVDHRLQVVPGEPAHGRVELSSSSNGPIAVGYERIRAPSGCSAAPLRDTIGIQRHRTFESVFHLACEDGASDGTLTIIFSQRYAPDTSLVGPPAEATWQVDVQEPSAVQAQSAVLGTSASVAGVPVSLFGLLAVASLAVWRRRRSGDG